MQGGPGGGKGGGGGELRLQVHRSSQHMCGDKGICSRHIGCFKCHSGLKTMQEQHICHTLAKKHRCIAG